MHQNHIEKTRDYMEWTIKYKIVFFWWYINSTTNIREMT